MTGSESMAIGNLITAISGLAGAALAKCKCIYRRDAHDRCQPACGFSNEALIPEEHELEIVHQQVDDIPVLIITKKSC